MMIGATKGTKAQNELMNLELQLNNILCFLCLFVANASGKPVASQNLLRSE